MKRILFLLIPLFVFSCTTDQTKDGVTNDTTRVIVQTDKESVTDSFITGNWKLTWVSGDSLRITPKMRSKIMKAKVFFKFNADKSFLFIKNDKTKNGTWSLDGNEICILLEGAKKDRCAPVNVIDPNQISFLFDYSEKIKAEIILSRITE